MAYPPSLSALFFPQLPPVATLGPTHDLVEERLRALLARATEAWPELDIPPSEFLQFLAQRLKTADSLTKLEELQAAELYLVCGCLRGDGRALSAFERQYLTPLDRALAPMKLGDKLDDVKQRVRQLLFVARPGEAPKLATYSGRGKLVAWLRVIAVREAVAQLEKARHEVGLPVEQAAALPVSDDDPELGYMKRTYRAAFKGAIEQALLALPARAQNLLRQQLIDGLTVTELGALYQVHHATVARWLVDARQALIKGTRRALKTRLRLTDSQCDSILRLAGSHLDVSISRLLHRPSADSTPDRSAE